jgi:nucleoside-diphosphate-sugar epimerase
VNSKARILVTGASGLIGGEITARLLARGHSVTALVNRTREIRSNGGALLPASTRAGGAVSPGTLALLDGDVAEDRLGWDEHTWRQVASSHDLVIHCAAITQFDSDQASYQAVNVEGVGRILALVGTGGMKLLHVSTAYVCGMRGGTILEGELDCEQPFANGYERSKFLAESLIRRSSVPTAIARPSIVVGDSVSGAICSFDTLYAAFRLITDRRIRCLPATAEATLDFVPIDHVAGGIVALAERIDTAAGGTFHLVSGTPVTVAQFRDAIAAYPQFAVPKLIDPADFDPAALPTLERRLHTRVASLYASYFQRDPRFSDANFRALTGAACPPTGRAFLLKLIDYCIAVGFLSLERAAKPEHAECKRRVLPLSSHVTAARG